MHCPKCHTAIYMLIKDVYAGDEINADQFMGIDGYQNPRNGQQATRPACHKNLNLMEAT